MENRLFKTSALALVLLFTGQFASAMETNTTPENTVKENSKIEANNENDEITVKGYKDGKPVDEEKKDDNDGEKTENEKQPTDQSGLVSSTLSYLAMPFVGGYYAVLHPIKAIKKTYNYLNNTKKVAVAQEEFNAKTKTFKEQCDAKIDRMKKLEDANVELASKLLAASHCDWSTELINAHVACAKSAAKLLVTEEKDEAAVLEALTGAENILAGADKAAKPDVQLLINNNATTLIESALNLKLSGNDEEDNKLKTSVDYSNFRRDLHARNEILFALANKIQKQSHVDAKDKVVVDGKETEKAVKEVQGNEDEYNAFHDAFKDTDEYVAAANDKAKAEDNLFVARHWMLVGTKKAAKSVVKFPVKHYWWTAAGVAGVAALGVTYALLTGRSVPGVSFVTSKIGSLFKNNPKVQEILQKQLVKKLA